MSKRYIGGLFLAFLLAACGSTAPTAGPTATPAATASPTPVPSPSSSVAPSGVASAAQAAALVLASDPQFGAIRPANPAGIGECCTYQAVEASPGFQVTINVGWGDCPAGCISHHQWVFDVDPDGTINLVGQSGDPNPPIPAGEGNSANITLHLRAGPTCPVVHSPPDPACEPRPVANAEVVLRSPDGTELGRANSNDQGEVGLHFPPGAYYVEPQPVQGLLGTAAPLAFSAVGSESVDINVDYDTGIR